MATPASAGLLSCSASLDALTPTIGTLRDEAELVGVEGENPGESSLDSELLEEQDREGVASSLRIFCVASKPSIIGIWMSCAVHNV